MATLPTGISEKLSTTRAGLSQRKALSRLKFDQVASRLNLPAETPALPAAMSYDQAAVTPIDIPDRVRQQASNVKDILVKLGIGNQQAAVQTEPDRQERFAVTTVQATTLPPLTPGMATETERTPA
jgi:hypothetical protein